jgi:replicative DNA helicase
VSSVSNKIQKLTRKLNIPIIVLSQLSRTIESRGDKRPSLSDLRSSGNIEQDASIVIGLFRPDYYAIAEARASNQPEPEMTHILDYVILKNRNGRTGSAERYCDIMTNRVNDDKEMLFRFAQPDIIYKDSKINELPNNFEKETIIPF